MTKDQSGGYVIPEGMFQVLDHATRKTMFLDSLRGPIEYKITRRQHLRMKVMELRERLGFWIAGYTPPEDDY